MSPAIVTETLYVLVTQENEKFVPDEIHVITTLKGREDVESKLLMPRTGQLDAFVRDYLPGHRMSYHVHLIGQDAQGQGEALQDVKTDEDNKRAANTIYQVLRHLKNERKAQVHASVSGGRRSMTFYMGQAFSLVAEPDDRLSHVLVNEPFERIPDFFYPPPEPCEFTHEGQKISSDSAEVTLGDLSVIKLGSMLGDLPSKAQTSLDFAIQIAQAVVSPPAVRLVWNKTSEVGQVEMLGETIKLAPQKFALLALYAMARKENPAGPTNEEAGAFLVEDLLQTQVNELLGRSMNDKRFKEVKSAMLSDLAVQVGAAANWLTIDPVGTKGQGRRRFRLRLDPQHLSLTNLPSKWKNDLFKALDRLTD